MVQIDQESSQQAKSKVGTTINEWAKALRKDRLTFASQIDEDRLMSLRALEQLHLPHFRQETLALPAFLSNPHHYFDIMDSQKFYINLPPKKEGLTRYRQINLLRDDALRFIQAHIPHSQSEHYTIVLSTFYDNHYSGNAVMSADGDLVIEMVRGSHAPLVSGEKTPEYFVWRNIFTRSFSYSFEDETLRRAVWRLILALPHEERDTSLAGISRATQFTPGYYEFTLIQRKEHTPLEPIFIDYRRNPAYQLPQYYTFSASAGKVLFR
jgi:hypothetical protein